MPQYVQLPDGSLFEVRAGESPLQAFQAAKKQYPALFGEGKEKEPQGGFGAAFSANLSRLGGEAALTAGKAGILDLAQAEEIYRRQQEKAASIFKPTEDSWLESPLQKLKEVAGGSAAYMLAPAAAAGAAAFAPVTVPVIGAAGVAAGLAGLGQYTGSNLAAQMEEGKKGLAETSGAAAVGAAVPQAALDVLSFRMMPGIKKIFGATGKELTEAQAKAVAEQTLKQKIGDYTRATGVSMGVEGATEVAQDFIEKVQAGAELTDPKARADYLESLIGGAALAGVLGPFGRGVERAGIAARGRELEAQRLEAEGAMQQSLTGLAGLEGRRAAEGAMQESLSGLAGMEGRRAAEGALQQSLTGLANMEAGREARQQFGTLFPDIGPVESISDPQKRLEQIEAEAEQARQAKDEGALLRLKREREALESRIKEAPSAFEQREDVAKQLAYYQNLEDRLRAEANAATTVEERLPILERLVPIQEQRRALTNALEKQTLPSPTSYDGLLKTEARLIKAEQKARDEGDAAKQLRAAEKLAAVQAEIKSQSGDLFGEAAYKAQQALEQRQEQEQVDAAALEEQRAIAERKKADAEAAARANQPPVGPQDYTQGTLFGAPERVAVPARTEMRLPELQQAVVSLSERPDLSTADRSLLERITDLVLPKRGARTLEGLQAQLRQFQDMRRNVASTILDRAKSYVADLPLSEPEKLAKIRLDAARVPQLQQAGVLKLDRRLRAIENKEAELEGQITKVSTALTPVEKFTRPIETRDADGKLIARATPAQRMADWVQDISRDSDTTQSRRALEDVLQGIEQAEAKKGEPLLTTGRRLTTPEERQLLGRRKMQETVPTGEVRTAEQPDLFAGTEAALTSPFVPKEPAKTEGLTPAQLFVQRKKERAEKEAFRAKQAEARRQSDAARAAEATAKRTEAEAQRQAEFEAGRARFEAEAAEKQRVSFAQSATDTRKKQDTLHRELDKIVVAKNAAIVKKEKQTKNLELSPELKAAVAAKEMTRDDAIAKQRRADIETITAKFDEKIKAKQAQIRAVRGPISVSEKGAAKPSTQQKVVTPAEAAAEMTVEQQDAILTDVEKKDIAEGTKTLEQVLEARAREGRKGPVLRNVRTGRVSEPKAAPPTRDLTEAQQAVEQAEANRLSEKSQKQEDDKHRRRLISFAKAKFGEDLSGLETEEIEAYLQEQKARSKEGLRRAATEEEQEKLAKDVAKGSIFDRIISHDYASRENTPLDATTTAAVDKGDLKGALESLAKNGSTPFVRMVAQRLLPMVENTTLETASLEGKGGEYNPNTDTVTLNKDALTEEDLIHEAGHAATNAVASYEAEAAPGMTRRQFLQGAAAGLTSIKLPNIPTNLSLAEQERMFFNMMDAWYDWVNTVEKLAPSLRLDPYTSLGVADSDLRGFLTRLEYNEVTDYEIAGMLEDGGLKKLQSAINASQRAIMSEAAKQGEGKAAKERFIPTKEQLAARDALEKLYAKMQGRAEFKDEYGNVSFKEFVSELLSNQQVRDKINQTAGLLRRIYEGFLRMLGIEPKTLSDKALEQAFEMFSPSKASVGTEERLASIMRGTFPGTQAQFSAAVPKEVQDMVNRTIARTATIGDKITANLSGLRMRTFIADQWAPVEALMKMGVEKAKIKEAQALQMQVYMRLFSNQQEYTNSALINGVPELRTDTDGIKNIEGGDAKANARTIAQALSKANKLGNQQAVERMFTMWMASLRAKQDGVGFDKLNFKNPPTAAELAAMDKMLTANPDVKNAFEEARRLYKEHNKRLLNLQVQTGAMSPEVAEELGKGDYIGYYRVDKNGVVELMLGGSRPMRIGNVIDQPYLKELVGGEQHILPFFSSMTQNTSMLMTIALRNMQNRNTAYMFQDLGLGKIHSVPDGQQAPAGKIRFKQKGGDYWFDADEDAFSAAGVPADLMMQGLQGVKTAVPALVKALAVPANLLRKAVRRLPTYTLRQTIRDPMHAWMTTGGNFVPVLSTWKELYKGMTNTSQTQMTLKEAAVVGNNVFSGDTEGVADMLRDLSGNPGRFAQTMMKLDEFALKGEAATRAVLYDSFRKKGMSHVEALLNTSETMNFSRRGTSASLHWLSQLTPFFNAQIQGLDAVYRALKGDTTFEQKMNARNMLLKRGALLAAGTMMYALMMEDDETYKNASPSERYGNWFVKVPGTEATIRVPIPFELGLIFKSMPEAFVNTAFGDTKGKEAVKALAKQMYMSSPFGIPTAVKGPLEVMVNYNMYSDQPIETAREKTLDSDQRYRESTTEVAKLLGKFGVLSPVQIDHLVRSYTSSAGIALLSMANFALRPATAREGVEKTEMVLEEMPIVGSLFQPRTGRGMVNAAFEDMNRIQRAAQTYKTLAGSDPQAAREYADEYAKEISLASFAGRFRQQMGEFADYKRMVAANPNLTGAEKRAQIERIKQQEIEYAKQLRKLAA